MSNFYKWDEAIEKYSVTSEHCLFLIHKGCNIKNVTGFISLRINIDKINPTTFSKFSMLQTLLTDIIHMTYLCENDFYKVQLCVIFRL